MSEPRLYQALTYCIEVSADALTATLRAPVEVEVLAADVIAKLKEIGIARFDDGQLIEALADRKGAALTLVVAQGVPAVDERSGKIDYRVPVAEAEKGLVARVKVDQVIASVGPNLPGTDGRDVFGKPIPHQKAKPFEIGPGVSLVKGYLIATAAGNLQNAKGVLSIHPLLETNEDEIAIAPVNYEGDVLMKGTLRDGCSLQATGCVIVNGPVEAANFKVDGWMHIKGGILGRDKGSGHVGGDLHCRFTTGARISVRGDIYMQNEIANSRIACTGRLLIPRGPISGGSVTANGGIICHTLGSPSGAPTLIEVGMDQTLKTLFAAAKVEMDANARRVASIREKIAPLMERLKYLTPPQKEKATEFLYEADELDESIQKRKASLIEPCKLSMEKALTEIIVSGVIHAGVTLRVPGAQAVVTAEIEGPLRVTSRKIGSVTEVVIEEDGVVSALPSTPLVDQFKPNTDRIAAEQKAA